MTDALILHMAAPLQRWGASSAGGRIRPTHPHPTQSGVAGMLAASLGRPRGHHNDDLRQLHMTVRVDSPGRLLRDWHTIGGGQPTHRTVLTVDGKRRGDGLIFEDWYLSGAAFTVALTGPPPLLDTLTRALANPVFPAYLGKRSCATGPDLVVHRTTTPEQDLATLPLHRAAPPRSTTVKVTYVYDQPPPGHPHTAPSRYLDDHPTNSGHLSRPVWDVERELPTGQCAGLGTNWLTALTQRL